MSAVATILKVFTKTITKLEKLAERNRKKAGVKTAKADVLDLDAKRLLVEADEADKAAKRLQDLLETGA
jgi:hypothetical protein